ncbi:SDR family oxidoreductase [Pseudolabrys sp. FHR47]|uniref:SDR family oxidoreductase n=1 Tax=Pseudolabrys sp. FHR47 TaxID=2562284 RepID=UPI0010BE50BB|nr:SDR family oxidoreductase [Pseudolabrys sp. FHR47]
MDSKAEQPPAALITGAARRIGAAIARALSRAGYNVVLHANHSRVDAEALAHDIERDGGRAAVVIGDLADAEALRRIIPAASVHAPLSLLVNNASLFDEDDAWTMTRDGFERTMAVNLTAPLFLAQAFAAQAPRVAASSIVNIVDQRVLRPTPKFFSYALSKASLHAATTTLAQAFAPLRVNAVAPGPTLPSPRQNGDQFAEQAALVPLGKGPAPEDIAAAVAYLAGAQSVTGMTIAVDGGQHLSWRTPDADITE